MLATAVPTDGVSGKNRDKFPDPRQFRPDQLRRRACGVGFRVRCGEGNGSKWLASVHELGGATAQLYMSMTFAFGIHTKLQP